MTERPTTDITFTSLDLPRPILQGIEEAGFSHCTPVQAETLPLALAGTNVAGQAQTGTGKTAAFLIAAFHRMLTRPAPEGRKPTQPRTLILAPTRELAIQIARDAATLGAHTGFRIALAYGGTGYVEQRRALEEGVDVLIGTPGRLIDYFKQRVFDLKAVQVAVLDEADRMFDLGFIKDVRYLLKHCPPPERRLNLLFSATLSWRVTELAYEQMDDPRLIRIEPERVTAERVRQAVYYPATDEKIALLIGLLRQRDPRRTIVFANTKRATEQIADYLKANGFQAAVLSGDVPQRTRQRLLRQFSAGELPVLVATDVAARGLDIPDVSHIFNFDLPQDAEDYVHRIGRTARFGASGDAISFACERYATALPDIEAYLGYKLPAEAITDDLLPQLTRPTRSRRSRGGPDRRGKGRGGRRPSKQRA